MALASPVTCGWSSASAGRSGTSSTGWRAGARFSGTWVPRGPAGAGRRPATTPSGWADEALQAILTDARRGTLATHQRDAPAVTFADAAAEYLRFVRDVRKRDETTVKDYESVINGYLLEEFGRTAVDAITPDDI